jgi:hypothetical protein
MGGCSIGVRDGNCLLGPCIEKREGRRQHRTHLVVVFGMHYFFAYAYSVLCCLFSS